jgi:hypothetical protein
VVVVRPKLQGTRRFALALLVLTACASPDAQRLEASRNLQREPDAGRQDAGADGRSDAGEPDAGNPADAGPRPDGECAAADEFPECTRPNALTVCSEGRCVLVSCEDPYVDCDGEADNGCESDLTSLDHCGMCRNECSFPNSQASCGDGTCRAVGCEEGFGNCDNDTENGCETALDSPLRCGDCETTCPSPSHGQPACNGGSCGLGDCDDGYGDCNGMPQDGCEQLLNAAAHCGACSTDCDPANATGECSSGGCRIAACASGFVDCNGMPEDGCETAEGSAQDCCAAGSVDCDGDTGNGCEASFDQVTSCGSCSNDCLALPHVMSAGCSQGVCGALQCDSGWADCDGLASNGCERSTRSLTDCGGCGVACAPARASASCSTGTCTVTGCSAGYGNCNGSMTDGCETSLSNPQTCGSCGNACGAGKDCCDGMCQDTEGSCFPWPCIPGTETDKHNHCGGCDVVCGLWCCL